MFNFHSATLILTVLLGLSLLETRLILSEGKSKKCREKKSQKFPHLKNIIRDIK